MYGSATQDAQFHSLIAAAVLACCAVTVAQSTQPVSPKAPAASARALQDARFREAMQLHRVGRWSAAYGRFAALADEGYPPAARLALEMLRNGERVYGTAWSAAPSQVAAWERAAGMHEALELAFVGE